MVVGDRRDLVGTGHTVSCRAHVLGPSVGGLLTDHAGWRWVFYLNVPVGAMALVAIWANLPATHHTRRPRRGHLRWSHCHLCPARYHYSRDHRLKYESQNQFEYCRHE